MATSTAAHPRTGHGIHASHAFWWGLFAVGGMTAAILVPIHILVQGVVGPLGIVPAVTNRYETVAAAFANPLVRLYFFVLISLPLFHAAHRLRFTLYDGLQIKHLNELINPFCYGGALVGSVLAGILLWQVP
jgi:fumarate reductase subunit D